MLAGTHQVEHPVVDADHLPVLFLHLRITRNATPGGELGGADLVPVLEVEVNHDDRGRGGKPAKLTITNTIRSALQWRLSLTGLDRLTAI